MNKEIWIFLSHSNEDYEAVRKIRNILEEMNTRPLMFFLKCLDDNDEIEDLIKREIKARTRFILCNSENARKSKWVNKEIEYISELHKPYDIIEITDSEIKIKDQFREFFRKDYLFFSYSALLQPMMNIVSERLLKYDFDTSIDDFNSSMSLSIDNCDEILDEKINKAMKKGRFIVILTSYEINHECGVLKELDLALTKDNNKKSILIIYLEKLAKWYFMPKLCDYEYIDLSDQVTSNHGELESIDIPKRHGSLKDKKSLKLLGDDVANAILVRLQGWGNIRTYGDNFRKGRGIKKDEEEADKLSSLLVEHLEGVDCGEYFNGPGMLLTLANLYKNGECVRKNLEIARQYYVQAYMDYGIEIGHYLEDLDS